jgi:hypothetical protein
VGDRVECNLGLWREGIVIKLFYTGRFSFRPNQCALYQVELDDGRLFVAPTDEENVIRRVRMGAQAKAERMHRPSWFRRATSAGLPNSEAWRLSESELWLPEEVVFKIVKINLDRANGLAHRLAVARLSSVSKAWDVHHESSESYNQMSHAMLAGSDATSLPAPADAHCRDFLLLSRNREKLDKLFRLIPPRYPRDLVWKARHLFAVAFPERDLESCFAARLHCFLRPAHVSDLEAALSATMVDLSARQGEGRRGRRGRGGVRAG